MNTPEADPDLSDAEDDINHEVEDVEIDQWGPGLAMVLWEDLGRPVVITLKVICSSRVLFQDSLHLGGFHFGSVSVHGVGRVLSYMCVCDGAVGVFVAYHVYYKKFYNILENV